MTDVITIRLPDVERSSLSLISLLSEIPLSKIVMPFISEGSKLSLGAVLLHQIDRSSLFQKDRFETFMGIILDTSRTGSALIPGISPEQLHEQVPAIIWDFFELMRETDVLTKLRSAGDHITVEMDAGYVSPPVLRALCLRMGETYISNGGSLERMDYQLATRVFFEQMLFLFYRYNAKGTSTSLSALWYTRRDLLARIVQEMMARYTEKARASTVEAIVFTGTKRKRGRPKKLKRPIAAREQIPAPLPRA